MQRPGRPRPAVCHGRRGSVPCDRQGNRSFFDRVSSNDFAVNFGGGVMAFFSEHVGLRGDVRYFRTLTDEQSRRLDVDFDLGDLNFWKWDIGAAFRF